MKTLHKSMLVATLAIAMIPAFANATDNTAKITEIEKQIKGHKLGIQTNQTATATNNTNIRANEKKISEINKTLEGHKLGIQTNQTATATNNRKISEINDTVNQHSDTILAHDGVIKANTKEINKHTDRIQAIDTDVRANQASIAQHTNTLTNHEQRIGVIEAMGGINGDKFKQDIDARINQIDANYNARYNKLDKKLSGGIASAVALSALPTPSAPNQHHLSFGSGYFNHQSAIAFGATGTSQTGNTSYKFGLSYNKAGGVAGGVGGSYRWK